MMKKIINRINASKSIVIMPHLKPDGDAVGSSLALAKGLLKLNKKVKIISLDEISYELKFLDFHDFWVSSLNIDEYDLIISLDSSDIDRLKDRIEFLVKPIINIDHHKTNTFFGELNFVDSEASATGEIIYNLLIEMNVDFDTEISEDLYTAIATDTGNFMYSNTTSITHEIIAKLMKNNIDVTEISRNLFQNIPLKKFIFDAKVLDQVEFYNNNQVGIVTISHEIRNTYGCKNTDNIVEAIRNIEGVEISVVIVEKENEVKISMRSKSDFDVAEIAVNHGGGGHKNAAGFGMATTLEAAKKLILEELDNVYARIG
ncbi:MAG: bifunctional oligoribonuclease/PAP phosphatase NrnA [Clostridiales bacterium]|nr:bifunctional oligoribonuclease/PAP phosphatase NrnA [Clostridiales bacterium]